MAYPWERAVGGKIRGTHGEPYSFYIYSDSLSGTRTVQGEKAVPIPSCLVCVKSNHLPTPSPTYSPCFPLALCVEFRGGYSTRNALQNIKNLHTSEGHLPVQSCHIPKQGVTLVPQKSIIGTFWCIFSKLLNHVLSVICREGH